MQNPSLVQGASGLSTDLVQKLFTERPDLNQTFTQFYRDLISNPNQAINQLTQKVNGVNSNITNFKSSLGQFKDSLNSLMSQIHPGQLQESHPHLVPHAENLMDSAQNSADHVEHLQDQLNTVPPPNSQHRWRQQTIQDLKNYRDGRGSQRSAVSPRRAQSEPRYSY